MNHTPRRVTTIVSRSCSYGIAACVIIIAVALGFEACGFNVYAIYPAAIGWMLMFFFVDVSAGLIGWFANRRATRKPGQEGPESKLAVNGQSRA